jgi:hypothetical protein
MVLELHSLAIVPHRVTDDPSAFNHKIMDRVDMPVNPQAGLFVYDNLLKFGSDEVVVTGITNKLRHQHLKAGGVMGDNNILRSQVFVEEPHKGMKMSRGVMTKVLDVVAIYNLLNTGTLRRPRLKASGAQESLAFDFLNHPIDQWVEVLGNLKLK